MKRSSASASGGRRHWTRPRESQKYGLIRGLGDSGTVSGSSVGMATTRETARCRRRAGWCREQSDTRRPECQASRPCGPPSRRVFARGFISGSVMRRNSVGKVDSIAAAMGKRETPLMRLSRSAIAWRHRVTATGVDPGHNDFDQLLEIIKPDGKGRCTVWTMRRIS